MAIGGAGIGVVIFVGLAATVVCAWPVARGWQRRNRYHLVNETPTETLATVTPGEIVLLHGTARNNGESVSVSAPISGDDALLVAWSIEEWQDEALGTKYWSPEASGLRSADLQIENSEDTVTLRERSVAESTGSTTGLFGYGAVTGFDVDDTLVDLGRTHGTRRYRETVVEDGDTITVRGTVETDADGQRVLSVPDEGKAIVSDLDPEALARRYRWAYRKPFYGSIGVIVVAMLFAALVVAGG